MGIPRRFRVKTIVESGVDGKLGAEGRSRSLLLIGICSSRSVENRGDMCTRRLGGRSCRVHSIRCAMNLECEHGRRATGCSDDVAMSTGHSKLGGASARPDQSKLASERAAPRWL